MRSLRLLCACSLLFCLQALLAVEPQIAHGYYHTLYLASDGTLWAVGSNSYGQLGDGTQVARTVPVKVDLSGIQGEVVEIAAGAYHSVLKTSTSRVYCWGRNNQGQCGQSTATLEFYAPTDTGIHHWARSIDAGFYHTLVALHDGNIYAFGDNNFGQIGNNNPGVDQESYAWVGIPGEEVVDVSAGRYHSMALTASGKVYTWGYNGYYHLGHGDTAQRNVPVHMTGLSQVTKISAGTYHSMALTENGYAYCWGRNSEAQCNPTVSSYQTTPYLARSGSKDICAGFYTSYALYISGQVYAWGQNSNGECGDGTFNSPVLNPTSVSGPSRVVRLPQDVNLYSFSCIQADGEIKAWGYNNSQMLNTGLVDTYITSATTSIARWPIEEIVDIEGGFYHVRAQKADGTVWSWGSNNEGEAGTGVTGVNELTAVQSQNGSAITDVSELGVGMGSHTMVGRAYGALYSWGNNDSGQLDKGTSGTVEPVPAFSSYKYPISLSNGYRHSAVVYYSGTVYTTGYNVYGQLGDGSNIDRSNFATMGIYNAKKVSAGVFHTAALLADGTVRCWGDGNNYELGNGVNAGSNTPVQVLTGPGAPLENVIDVVACYRFTMALDANGHVYTWGRNLYGATGQGTSSGYTTYATRASTTRFQMISGGLYHAAAIDRYGDVYTWGRSANGRLGNGTTAPDVLAPTRVSDATPLDGLAVDVSCGAETTHVLLANGDIYSAGYGSTGMMGDGSSLTSNANWLQADKTWYPQISISGSSDAYESGADANFTLTRSLQVPGYMETKGIIPVFVDPNQGVAVEGVDIHPLAQPIVIPGGSSSVVFTVDAIDDNIDEDDESVSIAVDTGPFYIPGTTPSASRNVIDNDTAAVIVTAPASPFTDEFGGWTYFTVKLATKPTDAVTVNFALDDTTEATLSQSSINIAPNDWTSSYYIFVDGKDDDIDDGDIVYNFSVTSVTSPTDTKYNGITPNPFNGQLTNIDNDTAGFSFIPVTGDTDEDGTIQEFRLVLNSEPEDNVAITFASSNTAEGVLLDNTLTFTPANWNDAGTIHRIRIQGVDDDYDDGDITYQINATPDTTTTDPNYNGMVVGNVSLKNLDNDTAGITVNPMSGNTNEDGTTATFSIQLNSRPFNSVQIPLSTGDNTEGQPAVSSLNIAAANWNIPQVVTVNPVDDDIVDGPQVYEIITGSASSSDPKYNGINPPNVSVTNDDDDVIGVTFNGTLDVSEDGVADSYTIKLTSKPQGGNVVIDLLPDAQVSVSPIQVSFSNTNWNIPKTINVSAIDDDIDEAAIHLGSIDHSIQSTGTDYDGHVPGSVSVNVTDNDTAAVLIREGSQPIAAVDTAGGVGNMTISISTGEDDTDILAPGRTVVIRDNVGLGVNNVTYATINNVVYADPVNTITVDEDISGIDVSGSIGMAFAFESGNTGAYEVSLASEPTSLVTITLSPDSEVSTIPNTPAELYFDNTNWNVPQVVTIEGVDDDFIEGEHTGVIAHSSASADPNYGVGLLIPDLTVYITDNDVANILVSPLSLTTNEAGASDQFVITLATDVGPGTNVTVGISSTDTGEGTVDTATAVLDGTNWDTGVTVTVTGVDDAVDDGNVGFTIATAAAGGSDPNYLGINPDDVSVINNDNDTAGVTIVGTGDATEGGADGNYTIVLDTEPTGDVTVNISAIAEVNVSPTSLTFNTSSGGFESWDQPQTITVTAIDDNEIDPLDNGLITHSASGGGYGSVSIANVVPGITDNDSATVTVTPTAGLVTTESGGTDTFTVVLDSIPDADVIFPLSSTNTDEATVFPASLSFNSSNWNTPQLVTITGVDDDVVDGNIAYTIQVGANTEISGNYVGVDPADATAINNDDDTAGVAIIESGGSTDIAETGTTSDTYEVVLTAQPAATVTVTVAHADGELVLSDDDETNQPSITLTFTDVNWDTPQTVTVTALDDASPEGPHTGTITHTSSSTDVNFTFGAGVIADVVTNISDDDEPGLVIVETDGSTDVVEGIPYTSSDTYTVRLQSNPTPETVQVTLAPQNGQVEARFQATGTAVFNFDSGNWNTPQTVQVQGIASDGVDAVNGEIAHQASAPPATAYDGLADVLLPVNVTDSDTPGVTIVESGGSTNLDESNTVDDNYTIVLDHPPEGNIQVDIATDAQLTADQSSVTFTPSDWFIPQTVTVSVVNDQVDEAASHNGVVTHSISTITVTGSEPGGDDEYLSVGINSVTAAIVDNDTAGIAFYVDAGLTNPLTNNEVLVTEDSGSTTVYATLTSQPESGTTVNFTASTTQINASVLSFDDTDWNTAKAVTLTGISDEIDESNPHNGSFSYTASSTPAGSYSGLVSATTVVDVSDNDTLGITVSAISGDTDESGTTATFSVQLDSDPVSSVIIPVSSLDTSECTLSTASLTFNPGSGTTPQLVTVTGVDDSTVDGNQVVTIQLGAASSGDPLYNGLNPGDVTVTNNDDDSYGLNIIQSGGTTSVSESGTTVDTFTVSLDSQPSGTVTVTVNHPLADDDVEVKGAGSYSDTINLSFDAANWNTGQTVSVRAKDDAVDEDSSEIAVIYVNATGADYTGQIANDSIVVNATVIDNDSAGINVTPSSGLTVTEAGGTASFDITLSSEPTADVDITVTSLDTTEGTVPATVLTFTSANYSTPQSVTVTGVDDYVDDGNITFLVRATASSSDIDYNGVIEDVGVTNNDDDTASMTLSPNSGLSTSESGNITIFNVYMGSEPTGDVVIDFTSSDISEGVISSSSQLTFTSADWFIPQTMEITGVDDELSDGTVTYSIDMAINGSTADSRYLALPADSVQIINFDDDTPGVAITESGGSTDVVENGASDTFSVVLDTEPTTDVTISINAESEVAVDKTTLTFTNSGGANPWNIPQIVTVSASADVVMEEDVPHTANVFLTPSGGEYSSEPFQIVDVSITDDDVAGVTVTPTSGLTIAENSSSDTFAVVLDTEPTSNVTIELVSSDSGEGYPEPASLTFTPVDWSAPQTVTVYGVDDEVQDGPQPVTISATARSADANYDSIAVSSVSASNSDDDVAGISVSTSTLTVSESGTSNVFSIVLDSEPTSPVSISISSDNTAESTVSTSAVTFTSATWDIPQAVSVTGVDDFVVDGDSISIVVLAAASSSDSNYNGIKPSDVTVTNIDDDVAEVFVSQSAGFTLVGEGGVSDTYNVVLGTEPTVPITITITTDSQVSTSVSSLVFDDSNWNMPQTVTVMAVDDAVDEGPHLSTITMSSTDAEYNGVVIANVDVNIEDNDFADILVSPTTGLTTDEGGGTATFTIVLTTEPNDDVTFSLASSDITEGTVSPASVTFTAGDWSSEQTVTVTGVDDFFDDGEQNFLITVDPDISTADSNYNGRDPDDVSVTNIDDDGAAVTITPTSISIAEGGTNGTYDVVLASAPSVDVTVTMSADMSQVSLSTTTLTFTTANWSTPQTVTVDAVDDAVAESLHNVNISHSSSGGEYDGVVINDVTVNITDDDAAGVTVTPTSGLQTTEAGATDSFTVVLNSEPTSSVTINVSSSDTSEGTVSTGSLTFTAGNWNTPQTVTVTGADDSSADGNVAYTIQLAPVTSDDTFYGGATPIDPTDVSVTNTDDEVAGITVTPTSGLNTTEGGGSSVFTVRLNTQPSDDVVIAVSSSLITEGTIAPASLTFTNSNWDTSQTVTVTGVDDDVDDDDQAYTIILDPAVSNDPSYGAPANLDPSDVSVTNIDDDTAGFTVAPTSGLVTSETGLTASFTVVLDTQPIDDVTFDVSSSIPAEGTVDVSTLTFNVGNWNVPQTVTITGQDDLAADGDIPYTIINDNVVTTDANYMALDPDDVSVINQDNDSPAVNISETGGSTNVSEVGLTSDTYTIVLATPPASQVDIAVNVASGEVSVSPTTVTFTTGDWDTPQAVTVTAVQDSIAEGLHSDLISHVASSVDGDYNGIAMANVTVNVTDDDTAGIIVNPSSGLVTTESGGTASFSVVLATEPTASVTIPVATSNADEGTVSTSSLVFTTGDWDTPQAVTVMGVDDSSDDGPVAYQIILSLPSSGDGQYAAINPDNVSVINSDDDGIDVVFTPSGGSNDVSEDGLGDSYSVVLNTQPTDDVVITPSADAQLNVTPASLTFTTASWDTPQSFSVTAIDDDVAEGTHMGVITHSASSVGDGSYNGLALPHAAAIITDNDTASVIVAPQSGLLTSESGDTDSFSAVLGSQPVDDVSFTVSSSNIAEGTVSPSSITFTEGNWDTPQTITVTGVEDAGAADGDVVFTIQTSAATSNDDLYNGLSVADVSVTNQDNDQPAVLISALDNSTDEANAADTATYNVRLATLPADTVTVALSIDVNGTLITAGPLSFTTGDWNISQSITVSAFDDEIDENAHSSILTLTPSSIGDSDYNALSAYNVEVNVVDDDTAGVTVTPVSGLITSEIGGTDTFTIVLTSEPTAPVDVAITSSDTDQITVAGSPAGFDDSNWNTPQTITLTGVDINNADDGDVPVTIVIANASSTDGKYSNMVIADVSATNRAVNNEPTLNAIADENITEDDPTQTVILTGISDGQAGENQTLTITAVSDNTSLVPNPVVIDNNDGTADLTYTPALNQSGTANISVTVQDDGGTAGVGDDDTVTRIFAINVSSDNDLPVITVANTTYNGEQVALVATTGATNAISNTELSASDVEDSDPTLMYTLVLRPGQGDIRNNNTASIINPGDSWTQADLDNGYMEYVHNGLPGGVTDGFAFKVTDSEAGESSGVFQIYVDRQAPSLAINSTDLDYTENDGAAPIDNAAVVTAGDIDPFDNGYLLVEWTAGQTANDNFVFTGSVSVDGSGVVSIPGPTIIGNVDSAEDGQAGSNLRINFVTTTPTAANITTLVRGIAYQNDSDDPDTTTRNVRMTVEDGFLVSGADGRDIVMTAENDAPVIGATTFGTILDVDLNSFLPVSDPDGTIASITVTAAPSLGNVTIIDPATGEFLYEPTPGLSGSDTFDIDVTDDLGATTPATITIEITDVNSPHLRVISDPPMFALDGDTLVYTPVLDTVEYTPGSPLSYELINKPAALPDPNSFGVISWDLTGYGGQVLRFSYVIRDGTTVGIQPVIIHVLPAPAGGG